MREPNARQKKFRRIPKIYEFDHGYDNWGIAGALKLGAVCRHWRELAFSAPELWSRLWVIFTPNSIVERHPQLLEECIARVRTRPMELLLCIDGYHEGLELSTTSHILYRIVPQCRKIVLHVDSESNESIAVESIL